MHKAQTFPWESLQMTTRTKVRETRGSCLDMQQTKQKTSCPCQFYLHTSSQNVLQRQERKKNCHGQDQDRKSTRVNSSHHSISYAVFCLKKKKNAPKFLLKTPITHAQYTNTNQKDPT